LTQGYNKGDTEDNIIIIIIIMIIIIIAATQCSIGTWFVSGI
jgi:flagellar basal body-associated protein FliL